MNVLARAQKPTNKTKDSSDPAGQSSGSSMGFRPELQGLRAIAVLLVIVHHLRPGALSGGFIGVDIFFVISGYLITAHLYRELHGTGKISLLNFWARRVRRLLPLAFTVLLATAVLVYVWIPATEHGTMFKHLAAAGLYVENWALVADATDYAAAGQMATAVQHYWSLSVEEQFYLFWPLLLLVGVWLIPKALRQKKTTSGTIRTSAVSVHRIMLMTIALIAVFSFIYGLWITAANPAGAYFDTAARAWQFAVGGLVALLCINRGIRGWAGTLIGWAGLVTLLVGAVMIPTLTRFPGTMALVPTLGTAAVLASGSITRGYGRWFSHGTWLSIPPARWMGDISYGAYLWHWPLIIVAPFVLNTEPKWYHEAGIVALTLLLAWLCQLLIENPLRFGTLLKPVKNSFIFALVGMLILGGVSWAGTTASAQSANLPRMSQEDPCYGARTLLDPVNCQPVESNFAPYPSAVAVSQQVRAPLFPGCETDTLEVGDKSCLLGDTENPKLRIAVVGDSHATAWLPALEVMAKQRHWQLETHIRSGCSPSLASLKQAEQLSGQAERLCTESIRALGPKLANDKSLDAVIVAAQGNKRQWVSSAGYEFTDPKTEGFTALWESWTQRGKKVVVLQEVPRLGNKNVPTCVATNPEDPQACSVTREKGLSIRHNLHKALESKTAPKGIVHADLTNSICSADRCFAVLGSLITYYDQSHLSHDFARSLAPELGKQLAKDPFFAAS